METLIVEFEKYLENDRKMASNSIKAYDRDVRDFENFLKDKSIDNINDVSNAIIVSYMFNMNREGRSASTINRKISSLRAFFRFLDRSGHVSCNPVEDIRTPKSDKKTVEYLTMEETERLLNQPDDSEKGKRDRAMLELMYATGMKVSEVIGANMEDMNLKMGFITCGKESSMRMIPMGKICREAIRDYMENSRKTFLSDSEQQAIFVNTNGRRLTRQGVWKIIRGYAEAAGIEKRITPQILRHSFAVHMIKNGADMKSLQTMLGHIDAATTHMYLNAAVNDILEVYEKTHPRA